MTSYQKTTVHRGKPHPAKSGTTTSSTSSSSIMKKKVGGGGAMIFHSSNTRGGEHHKHVLYRCHPHSNRSEDHPTTTTRSGTSSTSTRHHHHLHHSLISSTTSTSHHQISYIPKEVLADRILNNLPTIIIDTRDDDVVGGMIQGAIYCPESKFTLSKMKCLLQKAKDVKDQYRKIHSSGLTECKRIWVVFHCMETIQRSVRCAKRFYTFVKEQQQQQEEEEEECHVGGDEGGGVGVGRRCCGADIVSVKLLKGGADGWMRTYWNDARLVEGYDDMYWGYEEEMMERKKREAEEAARELLHVDLGAGNDVVVQHHDCVVDDHDDDDGIKDKKQHQQQDVLMATASGTGSMDVEKEKC